MRRPPKKGIRWSVAALAVVSLLGMYLFALDYKIRVKFESRRWNLPSRIYSDSYFLYPGRIVSAQATERKLESLGYKRVNGKVRGAGEFAREGNRLAIFLHDFAYPSEDFAGFPIGVDFQGERIQSLSRLDQREDLKKVKLEPELVASIFDEKMEDRTLVSFDQVPPFLVQAIISVEDERFYEHLGVDPRSLLRAFLTDLLHLRFVQGGSTLTQQLVKNYFLTSQKSLPRKFNEMFMALLLERRYSKQEILEAYLNEIYFGQRGPISVTGIEEASRLYFSKTVSQLTLAEAALLAGIIRQPGEYSPFNNPTAAYDRRNFVLKAMWDHGFINEPQFREARSEKIVMPKRNSEIYKAPFFVDYVQQELRRNYPPTVLQSEGIKIFTTLDMDEQRAADVAVHENLERYETRPNLKALREKGASLEGLLIEIQPQTGSIRAFVGGRDYSTNQFNHITMAHRQPGSTFKPFVYLTALALAQDGGPWTLASKIEDVSFSVPGPEGPWTPSNYDGEEHGTVTLRTALEHSYNIATARLAEEVGLDRVVAMARKMGIESPLEPYPAMALGSFEVTPLELIRAYTPLPNQGIRSEPYAITHVVTREGIVLEKKNFKMNRVITPEAAYLMNEALRGVIDRGTASSVRAMGLRGLAAGKTGTTSEYRDSWFVGYTPQRLALTWVGYDDGTPTGLSGASGALPIWTDFMKQVSREPLPADFVATDKIAVVRIDSESGLLFDSKCGEPADEVFIKGTEPVEKCDAH